MTGTTRYVCSRCGYARDAVEPVVEHIAESHPGVDAHVMTYEGDPEPPIHARLTTRLRRWWGNR